MDSEDSDSDDDSEDEESGGSGAPLRKVAPEGCVDRIRAVTQNPHIRASWANTGHVQLMFHLDPMFSPGRVGGEDWQSSSFNGGVLIEKKASPNKWQILMGSRFDAGEIHRSG
ncbi:hypothetical protein DVH24_017948 [Malus domestica]|uniref:Uncharacterized protein n=1 Tax=Malus domestica TaxID=3750 RepID=A0A498KET4_MALDO|nr:hypothetical protein DVH24_017948 [Malus domestica]